MLLDAPEVEAELEVVHSGEGFGASLSCIVTANPTANVRWELEEILT